jgi:DNA primase
MNTCAGTQISLFDYLIAHGWKPAGDTGREEVAGLCPLHRETHPSFYVNRRKQLFYCHACGRGGGLAQLRWWMESPALSRVQPRQDPAGLMEATYRFYQQQLPLCADALVYLRQRGIDSPAVIQSLRIGYAPPACLRAYLWQYGFCSSDLRAAGILNARGCDYLFRCLTFPLEEAGSLYGRSIDQGPWRHRFLPRPKGGLYGWRQAHEFHSLIVVEGLLDLAALWQAGFPQTLAALGTHLNSVQLTQLSSCSSRRVYLCFDADRNGSGQQAARQLSGQLRQAGVEALRVELPLGTDPAGLFAAGASAQDFQRWLERARP